MTLHKCREIYAGKNNTAGKMPQKEKTCREREEILCLDLEKLFVQIFESNLWYS